MKHLFFSLAIAIVFFASCTEEEQPPTVSYVFTNVSVDAGQTSATITCYNESVDDDKVHASVLLSKNENITDATKYPLRLQNDTLRSTISGLEKNTMYFFCFEVFTANEHKRTDEVHHFQTTSDGDVTVITLEAVNVTQSTATGGGSISADGNHIVSMRGVCWDTVSNPNALQSPHLVSGEGMGTFLVNITGLTSGTTYHMKAYAVCEDVVYYGNEVVFKTSSPEAATVTTGEVTNITRTSAMGSGEVTDDGGAEVTQRGVCWSTSHNPTIDDSHANSSAAGTGAFTANMTGLTPNTTYYVRAFAKNEQGIAYGEEVEFKTAEDESSPTVTTGAVTNITQTSAEGHGDVTADGGANVTERGVCWSTSHNPTMSGSHAAASSGGTGSYSVNMTNLNPGTTYYVRAYAKNGVGTAYGEEVTFSTTANKPTVTTEAVSNITQTTAQGGGNVTDDGGTEVIERGICWGTSHNPTTANSHTSSGTGTGGYTVNMTGLTSNTTYYVRAYATNSQGTSYGNEVSFKTSQNNSAPTVTTSQVTNITQTSATGGGNVTSDGGATVTERGICWSTSHNPTTSSSHANSGTGTGSYTVNMTGLTANTTYYVRAYAKNSEGTSYGSEVSFQTSATTPTVTTNQITNITSTTATGGGNVTNGGGANVTARGVCWSTSHNPTVSGSHTTNGTGTGNFTSSITGLLANTTYYVRAYATNSAGTAYGAELSFTTSQNVTTPTVTTSQVTNITQTTATGGGNVTNGGNATVTARGVCWSTSHNPTVSGSYAAAGSGGAGSFTVNMTGLTANTTYYVRAYATNSAGTAYGSEVSFTTTQNVTMPTVTTSQVTNITQATATGGGNVTGDGGANVTERGICWSTSHNPATSGTHANNGTGTGSYTVSMTGLTANTTYYVRAYAINSQGTAYGNEVSFITSQVPSYTIAVSANPTNGGTVTGSGTYQQGQSCIVHATANTGYTFANWTENGNVVSTNANYSFIVTSSRTLVAHFTAQPQAPTGAINGLFSVSATQQVYFSQGNLQYLASTNTWRFATNQYDYVGSGNSNISQFYNGLIDLFGWGTSGWNSGNTYYHPWDSNNSNGSGYLYGPHGVYDLTGSYANSDWGVYNMISNGGNTASTWRTLTRQEWSYVIYTRSTVTGIRFAKARIDDVKGLILLPDDWNSGIYNLNNTNDSNASFTSNIITATQWNILEQAGAVFLPAAGIRNGTSVTDAGTRGYYSSSTSDSYGVGSLSIDINNSNILESAGARYFGLSVRLVQNAQ